jgi:hypothetical protein
MVVLLVSVLWTSVGFAQGRHLFHPPIVPPLAVPALVRLTGELHLPEEKGAPVHSPMVYVHGTKWNFWLTKVDTLNGTNYGRTVLEDLFPRAVHLSRPEELLKPLQRPEIAGQPLTIEGWLYVGDRKLVVTAVRGAEE